jgi:octaprenyl-diphosphate synthase
MSLDEIYQPIKHELEEVGERLAAIVDSEIQAICELYDYVLSSGGKRIRPALVLLSAKSLNSNCSRVTELACAVELIHMASLLHDDIVDSAKVRRGKPAAHIIWGTSVAITMGDYLSAQAMELLTKYKTYEAIETFSKTVERMAEGELLEIASNRDIELTEGKYIRIISGKTASLMSASCETAAKIVLTDLVSGHSTFESELPGIQNALAQYGMNFGILYQMMDDVLDLISTDDELGKPARNSIREGNLSLPIIYALRNSNGKFKQQLLTVLSEEQASDSDLWEVIDSISNSGAFSYVEDVARGYADSAKKALSILEDSEAKRSLLCFADLMMNMYSTEVSRWMAMAS